VRKAIQTAKTKLVSGRHIIGWREKVALPELGIVEIRGKIDTGARTSALHALDLKIEQQDGEDWISFHVPHLGERRGIRHRAKVLDRRLIKNTGGVAEERYVIRTQIVIGRRKWQIELSLTDREKMKHDLILGRTAIGRHRILVAPDKSYLAGRPLSSVPAARETNMASTEPINPL